MIPFDTFWSHALQRKTGYAVQQSSNGAYAMKPSQTKLKLAQAAYYRICVQGVLDASWAADFAGLTVTCDPSAGPAPVTILTGQLTDQAMLLGVLNGLYGLGLPLLLVEWLADSSSTAYPDRAAR
jgi:hypothetical protein